MINNIRDFAAYFGATHPIELERKLSTLDSYVSSATFFTSSGDKINTDFDFICLKDFPESVVSVVLNASKEGCDYEPTMTPLTFPFSEEDIDEAIDYLNSELNLVDEWGEDFVELYGSQSESQFQPDKLIETIADAQEFVASK